MLTSDDAALAAREGALPGIALVLDGEAFAQALRARLPDARITGASEFYARYKPGHSCVVAYRVGVGDGELDVYARAMRRESFDRIGDLGRRAPVDGPLGRGGLLMEGAAVSVYAFPNDRRIETLARLGPELLSQVVPTRPDLWESAARRLRYWPERRFTAALDGAAVKLYAERSYGTAGDNAQAFRSRGPLRLPECLGRSDELRALALEWLPGRSLDRLLVKPGFDPSLLAATGAALAELHSQKPDGMLVKDPAARSEFLRARGRWVATVRPDLAERVEALVARLDLPAVESSSIHGDFSPTQVLVDGDRVAILDLDDAAMGDPAEDLGVFISRLELRAVRGKLDTARREELVSQLLSGYGRPVDHDRLRLHVAATLVRRLPGSFRRRAPNWMSLMDTTLARAEEVLAGG